ncbi:type II toxin-antitoxin system RelE/ParE family toxin [Streptococcus tangpeifui]|uniref:type II toxin-antitoxin system RelE/ParE family toxin n=1 Tax=Streptococcus tangpeifui TaxID=2709400 RepID=UPI0013EAE72C|nr:type II toxin-antitoxin system RelE/ParE family toxin [Streptococcus sp. ZJ1593]
MKNLKFELYVRPNGKNEFLDFLEGLPQKDKNKLLTIIDQIQSYGLLISQKMEWVKRLDNEIFEIRSKVSSNIQRALYFHVVDNRYIITHGFTKKTQKTPKSEIQHAKQLKIEFEEREKKKNDNREI